jgi:hypothetical protein
MTGAHEALAGILLNLDNYFFQNSKAFHREMEKQLRALGCTVTKEFPVKNRGDGHRGYIDLVVFKPFRAAIELDNVHPRTKSVCKVKSFSGERFVILRKSKKILCIW